MEKYQLTLKIRRIHRASKVTVVPIMIGALGSISKRAKSNYGKRGVPKFIGSVQLSAILGTVVKKCSVSEPWGVAETHM